MWSARIKLYKACVLVLLYNALPRTGSVALTKCRKIRETHSYRTFLSRKNAVKTNRKLRRGKACYVSQTVIPAPYDLTVNIFFFFRGSLCLGQVSRNALWQSSLALPTFCYRWATFLILLTLFFPCDFHCAVTKTILSTNIRSVYMCCFNAILTLSTDPSWRLRYYCYKTTFYWQLFHLFQNQNKYK